MFNDKTYNPQTAAPKAYTPPADINVALLHTIIAVTALRDVLLKENDALEASKTAAFLELQDEFRAIALRYADSDHDMEEKARQLALQAGTAAA